MKKIGNSTIKIVQNWAHTHQLWTPGERILIGISGGPDSVCLLQILAQIAKKSNLTLFATHINYRLRGQDSDADERFVRSFCKKLNVPLFVYRPKLTQSPSEESLRSIRYKKFEKLRQRLQCATVAVGHNKNDQAETLLLHLFRGCGAQGMQGMHPKNNSIIRPLLALSRDEIITYLSENSLNFCIDKTNSTSRYTRNIIRNTILPSIQKDIQPNIIDRLAQSALLFADDAKLLDTLESLPHSCNKTKCTFNSNDLNNTPPAIQKRFLKQLLVQLRDTDKNITANHIAELQKALQSKKNKHQQISFLGLIYERKGDTVSIRKKIE